MTETDEAMYFAAEHDMPIPYRQRIRDYYLALGYEKPYRWANYADVPFTSLKKPLSESTVALVSTSAPFDPEKGDQGPGAVYNPPPNSTGSTPIRPIMCPTSGFPISAMTGTIPPRKT